MNKKVHSKNDISNSDEYNVLKADELLPTLKPKSELEIAQDRALQLGYEVVALREQISKLMSDNNHLKQLLDGLAPQIGQTSPLIISDEEMITTMEIQKIKEISMSRKLTLDEIKQFDLLVKNKNLSQGKATDIGGKETKSLRGSPIAKLVDVAKKPLKEG